MSRFDSRLGKDFDRDVQVPPTSAIFGDRTDTEIIIPQPVAIPEAERHPGEMDLSVAIPNLNISPLLD